VQTQVGTLVECKEPIMREKKEGKKKKKKKKKKKMSVIKR
jgi:hypothetical protein